MEDGPSNNASCFRRLTECFLSPRDLFWDDSCLSRSLVVPRSKTFRSSHLCFCMSGCILSLFGSVFH
ncbi:cAMP and cAMP-inhibited cGMP 3',5'-cyclic phosphodiesterase 10A [Cricetulus griseus]|nr:cAMP and cAMP-inhibited cGMP 3',5'-cyclic phosphodiesterase 10A [Cricetulus griseus]